MVCPQNGTAVLKGLTISAASCSSSPRAVSDGSGSGSGRGCAAEGAVAPERGNECGAGTSTNTRFFFPNRASSADNELAALTEVVMQLLEARDAFPTTLDHDEVQTWQPRGCWRCNRFARLFVRVSVASDASFDMVIDDAVGVPADHRPSICSPSFLASLFLRLSRADRLSRAPTFCYKSATSYLVAVGYDSPPDWCPAPRVV